MPVYVFGYWSEAMFTNVIAEGRRSKLCPGPAALRDIKFSYMTFSCSPKEAKMVNIFIAEDVLSAILRETY